MDEYDHYPATSSSYVAAINAAVSASSRVAATPPPPMSPMSPTSPTSTINAPVAHGVSGVEAFSAQWRRVDPKRRSAPTSSRSTQAKAKAKATHTTKAKAGNAPTDVTVYPVRGIANAVSVGSTGGSSSAKNAGSAKPRKLTDEEKIEKHRMIVRRSYYQKKELKARLRQDIERLEMQYSAMMKVTDAVTPTSPGAMRASDLLVCTCCESIPCVRTLYRELSVQKEQLRKQNDALEEQILQHLTFHDKIAFIAARQLEKGLVVYPTNMARSNAAGASRSSATPLRPKRDSVALPARITVETSDCCLSFEPLTEEECFATIRDVQHAIVSQQTATPSLREVGLPVLGWNRKRTFGAEPKFSLRKHFHGASSVELATRTWRAYTESADAFAHLYSGTMNMRVQLLQRVNANNVLFHRSLQTDMQQTRCMTFFQLSRVQIAQRHFLVFNSIEPTRILPELTDRFNWLDMFSWLCFTDVQDADGTTRCEIEFGGNVPSLTLGDTDFWMMEFLSYALRFENRFVRPVFHVDLA